MGEQTTSTYNKPFFTVDEQLDQLETRGMDLGDREAAYRELQAIGYYRLSGYWHPLRIPGPTPQAKRPDQFIDGATFAEVLEAYRFDERLRVEVLHALARIEVAMRFSIGHLLGRRGAFAHTDARALSAQWTKPKLQKKLTPACGPSCRVLESDHDVWVRGQEHLAEVSNEAFIAHFHSSYGTPLPVWTATELMKFGDLNRLCFGLTQRDRQQVASEYDLFDDDGQGDAATLTNWLEHFRQSRNFAAHHARLWNRNHPAPLAFPDNAAELAHLKGQTPAGSKTADVSLQSRRLYGTLAAITFILARIDGSNSNRDALIELVTRFAGADQHRWQAMGFPPGWETEDLWAPTYQREPSRSEQAVILRDVELLSDADASPRLKVKPTLAAARAHLRYYRKNGAVLSVPGVDSHRYPAFQFDTVAGDLRPLAVVANRRLLDGAEGTAEQRWAAMRWWNTRHVGLPGGVSPSMALVDGALSRNWLDGELAPRDDE